VNVVLRRIGIVLAVLILLAGGSAALILVLAHRDIDALDPGLPAPAEVVGLGVHQGLDLPVRLRFINTASQPTPRSQVLDPGRDPSPQTAYVMSHPSFVLEWADGRIFLVDVGMDRAAAVAFGRPLEWVGAEPIRPLRTTAEALSDATSRVRGVAFTHLHVDHVAGIDAVCAGVSGPVRLVQTRHQAELGNLTTRPARTRLSEASCLEPEIVSDAALAPVPGFPGLAAVRAAGHTPGSTLFVVHVREPGDEEARTWILAGDIANAADGLRHDLAKPWLYSLLLVPENVTRLAHLRRYLSRLAQDHGALPVLSHDQIALEASGLPSW
jgi:glyoxylase-like metal-dependent hydrolase (beta-lactamase superfamily II)